MIKIRFWERKLAHTFIRRKRRYSGIKRKVSWCLMTTSALRDTYRAEVMRLKMIAKHFREAVLPSPLLTSQELKPAQASRIWLGDDEGWWRKSLVIGYPDAVRTGSNLRTEHVERKDFPAVTHWSPHLLHNHDLQPDGTWLSLFPYNPLIRSCVL